MINMKCLFLFLGGLSSLALAGRDFYGILGVKRNANSAEIKKAYRKLSLLHHPDKNKDDDDAKRKFQEISSGKANHEIMIMSCSLRGFE